MRKRANWCRVHFNPRSREGSDSDTVDEGFGVHISIHAPAKGATFVGGVSLALILISIHAPAKGATSRLLRLTTNFAYFNPRSREGSDESICAVQRILR